MNPRIAFFGTPVYSLSVLEKLYQAGFPVTTVISKPPRPVGREQKQTETPVAIWAINNRLHLLTPGSHPSKPWFFSDEKKITQDILAYSPEILIVADYTQKIPLDLINQTTYGGLNVHPSLLPAYRGPAPVPWAIVNGETETGVSIVTLSEKFDQGNVVSQEKEPILPTDTADILLTRLFETGGKLLVDILPKFIHSPTSYSLSPTTNQSYFPRLTREHGFEPWEKIRMAIETGKDAVPIERKWRAFHPWPGIWTKVNIKGEEKRLKLLKVNLQPATNNLQLSEIQLEGKKPLAGQGLLQLVSSLRSCFKRL